ncbi:MAG: deoxyribodipyrimidine photo-lyase [Candidatus Delongbacteria bacterium]|nr:deoxyribodipyrimidine photo-lyase [Candidatus Delongbacteria bacterium]
MNPNRIVMLREGEKGSGGVVYWMNRDQRVFDNWALSHALQTAERLQSPMAVVFVRVAGYLGADSGIERLMEAGLKETERRLSELNIRLMVLKGKPEEVIPAAIERIKAGYLVTDFNPLRIPRMWRHEVADRIRIPMAEVDAHNVVPCRWVSGKAEYGAHTLRPKLYRLLPQFLDECPRPVPSVHPWPDLEARLEGLRDPDWPYQSIPLSHWWYPVAGESAAEKAWLDFLQSGLADYDRFRNDPTRDGQSGLSPYLHFGWISAQRMLQDLGKFSLSPQSSEAFIEQLLVRRELSDNFCCYNPDYDRMEGIPAWARKSLEEHRMDDRPYRYHSDELENAQTHDPLWNAAQTEMVVTGKMHGYLRMYWAKKILEWSSSPEEAWHQAIRLNDRYHLDGRDPNGYAGIAWSLGGVHDRPWFDRPVIGKIRAMTYDGCRRKFKVDDYIRKVNLKLAVSAQSQP